MKTKELCYIAVIAAIESVVFTSFSFILYLECITFTILVFSMTFQTKQAVLGSVVFTIINLSIQGVTPWSIMYCLIYPTYSLCIGLSKNFIGKHLIILSLICGFLSFLSGQLLQLPFMLISENVTIIYILLGLKTSLVQGILSAGLCFICYQPVSLVLKRVGGRLDYEKNM